MKRCQNDLMGSEQVHIYGMNSEWMEWDQNELNEIEMNEQGQNVIRLMEWDKNERLEWIECHF